jgi:hypothetical protein
MQVNYLAKYLKYKQKYLDLKEEMMGVGGGGPVLSYSKSDAEETLLKKCAKATMASDDIMEECSIKVDMNPKPTSRFPKPLPETVYGTLHATTKDYVKDVGIPIQYRFTEAEKTQLYKNINAYRLIPHWTNKKR